MKKQSCKLCNKEMINLTRHMYLVHNISLSNVKEASNIKEFIYMCCILPIPATKLIKLMKNKQYIEKYLAFDVELPWEMKKVFLLYFEKYQQSKCKLLMATVTKHASDDSSASTNVTQASKSKSAIKSMEV